MQKGTFLMWIIVVLVLLNIGTLLFVVLRDKRHPRPDEAVAGFDYKIESTLGLDDAQKKRFGDMKFQHHRQMMQIDEKMRQPFEAYFSLLGSDKVTATQKDSLEQVITSLYRKKVAITYAHFSELKALCRPEQKARFERIVPELLHVISQGQGQGPTQGPPPPMHGVPPGR